MKKLALSAVLFLFIQSADAQWTTSGSNIYNSNSGLVGIGTSNPNAKLNVNNGALSITGTNSWGGSMAVFGPNSSTDLNCWGIENTPNGLNFWRPYNSQQNQGNFFLFLKHSTGNVGIKTDNPTAGLTVNSNVLIGNPATVSLPSGYKLYVETGILTEKIKVAIKGTSNWADFVFAKNYVLPSLLEVEKFISENKHLPEIPSAEEVVKNGVDLAVMDAKLLQKVEELTLYVIELQKQIDSLKQGK